MTDSTFAHLGRALANAIIDNDKEAAERYLAGLIEIREEELGLKLKSFGSAPIKKEGTTIKDFGDETMKAIAELKKIKELVEKHGR